MKVLFPALMCPVFYGCTGKVEDSMAQLNGSDTPPSCVEILDDEHIRNADHHGSERYRMLVSLYRKDSCPAPEFHNARKDAVDRANVALLAEQDRALSCYDNLTEKTRIDELVEWYKATGPMPFWQLTDRDEWSGHMTEEQVSEMTVRKRGLDSLYKTNGCKALLTREQKAEAKEAFRAPLRHARRNFLREWSEENPHWDYGMASDDEQKLSCQELVEQIRLEEDNRVYHHGTASRTIILHGISATALGAVLFGAKGAVLGLLLDSQTAVLVSRVTMRERRLLRQMNRKTC